MRYAFFLQQAAPGLQHGLAGAQQEAFAFGLQQAAPGLQQGAFPPQQEARDMAAVAISVVNMNGFSL